MVSEIYQQIISNSTYLIYIPRYANFMLAMISIFWLVITRPKSMEAKEGYASYICMILAWLMLEFLPGYFQFAPPFAILSYQKYQIFHIPFGHWWSIALYLLAADLSFYVNHRLSHAIPLFWISHGTHHTGIKMTYSLILRGTLMDSFTIFIFMLPWFFIGFSVAEFMACQALVFINQGFCHTEKNWPRFLDKFMVTPAIHRVHHSKADVHLDKNFGGLFSVWDSLFKTKYYESGIMDYGLTDGFVSQNPIKIFFHLPLQLAKTLWETKNPIYLFRHRYSLTPSPTDLNPDALGLSGCDGAETRRPSQHR